MFTQIPGTYTTVLFNNQEFYNELCQAGCIVADMAEYVSWILVELGYPVLTPPWVAPLQLTHRGTILKSCHEREVYGFIRGVLNGAGYNGEELVVTSRCRIYSAISFLKE